VTDLRSFVVLASALFLAAPLAAGIDVDATLSASLHAQADPAPLLDLVPDASGSWAWAHLATPVADARLSGPIVLEGTAEPAHGFRVVDVSVWVDDHLLGYAEGTTRWSFPLDTAQLLDGAHTLHVEAMAIPAATPTFLVSGNGDAVAFSSLNQAHGVVLFQQEVAFDGEQTASWTAKLAQDYRDVRVTLERVGDGGPAAPQGQLSIAYKGTSPGDPARTWVATYGALDHGAAVVERNPDGVLRAPGELALQGALAGSGHLRIVVEGLPVG